MILSFKKFKNLLLYLSLKVGVNVMNSQHLRLKWHFEKLDKYGPRSLFCAQQGFLWRCLCVSVVVAVWRVCVWLLSVYSWLSLRPLCSGSSWLSAEILLLSQSVHTTLVPIAVGCWCHPRPCGPHIPLCVCFCLGILFYMRSKHFNGFGITVCCKMSKISTSAGLSISLL